MEECYLCPRRCGVARSSESGRGFCRMGIAPVLARAALHHWEEPCISGKNGSGALFFSGCALRCGFCQNRPISHDGYGKIVKASDLREIMNRLVAQGAHNINLVTGSHFIPAIAEALAEPPPVPVVFNCGGYERVDALRLLDGKVQVYLPDFKFGLAAVAEECAAAPDYPLTAKKALEEMLRQAGPCVFDDEGMLKSGVLVRHLVLPGHLKNTFSVLDILAEAARDNRFLVSLMNQYTPCEDVETHPPFNRRVTGREYKRAVCYMKECGLTEGFLQESASADRAFIPDFDLTGIK